MRKFRPRSLRIGVSQNAITILGISGPFRRRAEILSQAASWAGAGAGMDAIGERLTDAIRESGCTGLPATVVIASECARLYLVEPPRNAVRLQDCMDAASMRFQTLYGESAAEWRIAADWDFSRPFLGCALPAKLLEQIGDAAAGSRLALVSVVPQFIAAWNATRRGTRPGAWFAVINEDILTLGMFAHGRLAAVRSLPVASGISGPARLAQLLGREALRLNVEAPSHIRLYGDVPSHWAGEVSNTLTCEILPPGCGHQLSGNSSPGLLLASTGARL